jgi:hypothetical protein
MLGAESVASQIPDIEVASPNLTALGFEDYFDLNCFRYRSYYLLFVTGYLLFVTGYLLLLVRLWESFYD